jgi:hypothetical protein
MSTSPISDFWQRDGLDEEDGLRCLRLIREWYVGYEVDVFREQGYCSFTLLVSLPFIVKASTQSVHGVLKKHKEESLIVQIRPTQHALDMHIARVAKETYASLAPDIRAVDLDLPGQLRVYEMQKMHGTPLSRLLPCTRDSTPNMQNKQKRLVESFATLLAQTWPSSSTSSPPHRTTRADSPMASALHMLSSCTGKIGSSILPRLEKLGTELPDPFLREVAKTTVVRIKDMEDLPVVLNHGDFIPSNVLVDEETWEISGLVDWAEAEDLPFGMCMYGVEYVLGYLSAACQTRDEPLNAPVFVYHENAAYLRELFWRRLCELEPDVKSRLEDVKTMRDAGVLLWFGYAWDDGAIDRVVNEKDDGVEVACLRAFVDVT